jgi:hypothetical protein
MKKILFFFALFTLINQAFAQQEAQLKGKVLDTLGKAPLSQAVISLFSKKDSALLKFTRSGKDGSFYLSNIAKGNYFVMITYPRFADYVDAVNVDAPIVEMGAIALTQKAALLKEVIIQSGRAIRIKGDTTEFVADSFIVKEGATVEDLLKQFPGFQVDSKGQITAQGQRVQKVLVDGEEFFGDDPTMATQNIAARAVDKVQVYDTKTDQENLTGLGGNNQGKTVDIKLKANSKKGAFGKAFAGSDFQKYHDAKVLYNRFVGKKKVSVYGTKSTVSTGSLNWEDRQKLGMENDMEYDEINGYYYSFGSGDEFNDWSLRGLPDSYTAGGLFNNKWNEDKHGVNTSYRYNRLSTVNESSTLSQTILSNGLQYSNRSAKNAGLNQQHALNGKYEWKLDSLTSFKFTTAGIYKTTQVYNHTNSFSLNEKLDTLNKLVYQINENESERKQLDNQLAYKQLFKKKDRQLMMTLRFGLVEDDQEGMLNSKTELFKDGVFSSDSTTDQQKIFKGNSQTIGTKVTFSEPLSSKLTLVTDYSYNNNNSSSERYSFNKSSNDKYDLLDSLYSNNFDLTATSHSGMAVLRYIGKKARFAFGSGLSAIQLKLNDLGNDHENTYSFLNITPQATYSYSLKQQTRLSFNYRGSTRQPGMNQLQPLRDNTDQLNIFIGNPNLKVGFNHRISTSYSSYKVLTGNNLYLDASYSFTQNDITNSSTIDYQTGKRTYSPVNVNGNYNWNFWSYWSHGQGDKKLRHNIQLNGYGGQNINFINNQKAINSSESFALSYRISYAVNEKYNFGIGPRIGYNSSRSSLQKTVDNNYYSYGGSADGYVALPWKIEINSNVNADLRQRIAAFDQNTNIIQWNGSISKKVFKDKSGKIIFQANDILNQNKGYNRVINSSFVTDERYLRVSRYFLLKFEWSFNKMPTGK